MKLADLRAVHVEAMLAAMTAAGRGLVTRRRTVAVLSSALSSAEKKRLVTFNVVHHVELPPERTPTRPIYDGRQLARFLASVDQDRLFALWRLYGVVGLRRGEGLALCWSDVDLEAGTLRVERSLGIVNGRLVLGPPKSESGRRTVALDRETVAALRAHRGRQSAEKLALGAGFVDTDLVFCREDGHPLRPEWTTKHFHALTSAAKLPLVHLHDLRHSAASMALTAGVPMKVVQGNLGHSTLAVTANVYSHVTTDLARDSAERVAAAIVANRM